MSVFVVGALHLDVVVRAPHLPQLDETVAGSRVDYVFGGKGGNQAVAAARMGADVSFAGRAGSDAFGDSLRRGLAEAGVGTDQLQLDPGASGMSTAIVTASGEYGAVIVSAANRHIAVDEIEIPKGTRIVLLQNEIPEEVNVGIALKAKAAGAQLWVNGAPARVLPDAMLNAIDLLIVNRVEAQHYAPLAGIDILTTYGADGVGYDGRRIEGFAVDVISAHGAGDMFIGALAADLCAGAVFTDAIGFAQAAAALQVSSELEKRGTLCRTSVLEFRARYSKR